MMAETGSRLAGGARDYWQQGRGALHHMDERVEDTVRERPLMALFAAIGVGVAIGIVLTVACPASFPQMKHRD
jgi:ElaB/YqjD/DUF883 family membrane-anchored ribosome-binding protein